MAGWVLCRETQVRNERYWQGCAGISLNNKCALNFNFRPSKTVSGIMGGSQHQGDQSLTPTTPPHVPRFLPQGH